MGLAYREALDFDAAKGRFKAVLDAKTQSRWIPKADAAWMRTDRTVRAMAGITVSDLGKRLAVKETVSRAQLTSLLTHELGPDALNLKAASGRHPLPVPSTSRRAPRDGILARPESGTLGP